MPRTHKRGVTLLELAAVVVVALIALAILWPVSTGHPENARRTVCANNLKQIGSAFMQYVQDWDGRFPTARPSGRPAPGHPRATWRTAISPYIRTAVVFGCPAAAKVAGYDPPYRQPPMKGGRPITNPEEMPGNYSLNLVHRMPGRPDPFGWEPAMGGKPLAEDGIAQPAALIVATDSAGYRAEISWPLNRPGFVREDPGATIHSGGLANYLFADGHVKSAPPERIPCTAAECWWSVAGRH